MAVADDEFAGAGYARDKSTPGPAPTPTDEFQGAGVVPPAAPQNDSIWPTWATTGRALGLGTRDVLTGLAVPPMVSDWVGLPRPQTPREQIQSGLQTGAAATIPALAFGNTAPLASAAGPVTQGVAQVLGQQPVRQAITGAVSGGASATAGALGLPPWMQTGAGYAAALLSGMAPGASTGWANASDQALMDTARTKYQIPIFPGQAGSPISRYAFSFTSKYPTSGAAGALRDQQDAFNTAVGNTFGATTIDGKLTPEAMTAARAANSAPFEALAKNTTVKIDQQMVDDLQAAADKATAGLTSDQAKPVLNQITGIRDLALKNNGQIPSDWLVSTLGSKSVLSRGAAGAGEAKPYFSDVRDALNDVLTRNASPDDLANLRQAQQNWKNMRTVEGLVAKGSGDVSPVALKGAVANNKFQQAAYTGGGDLGELGEIGQRFLKAPPESGTTERGVVAHALTNIAPLAMEKLFSGEYGEAAKLAASVAVPYVGSAVVNPLMRMGAMNTGRPSLGGYYARALANPAPVISAPPANLQALQ